MTNQEILTKAIQKAVDGGWLSTVPVVKDETQITLITNDCISVKWITPGGALAYSQTLSIFNHDFAKALWGEEMFHYKSVQSGEFYNVPGAFIEVNAPAWIVHLVGMTTSADPIKYLGENI